MRAIINKIFKIKSNIVSNSTIITRKVENDLVNLKNKDVLTKINLNDIFKNNKKNNDDYLLIDEIPAPEDIFINILEKGTPILNSFNNDNQYKYNKDR